MDDFLNVNSMNTNNKNCSFAISVERDSTVHLGNSIYRLVCDSWLEFRFLESEVGERVLSHVVELRSAWNKLIQAKLNGKPSI